MKILEATLEHINITSDLFTKYLFFYQKTPNKEICKRYIEDRIKNNESKILIAYIDNEPVGFCQLYFSFSSLSLAKTAILNDLYVESSYRNKGVGKKLIEEAEKFSKNNGYISIQLETEKTNNSAITLYENLGYQTSDSYLHYSKSI